MYIYMHIYIYMYICLSGRKFVSENSVILGLACPGGPYLQNTIR